MDRRDRNTVAAFAAALPSAYLQCRDYGHAWTAYTASWVPQVREWHRVLVCMRCQGRRVESLAGATAVKTKRHYEMPQDYAAPPGLGPLDSEAKALLRLALLSRSQQDEQMEEEAQ